MPLLDGAVSFRSCQFGIYEGINDVRTLIEDSIYTPKPSQELQENQVTPAMPGKKRDRRRRPRSSTRDSDDVINDSDSSAVQAKSIEVGATYEPD